MNPSSEISHVKRREIQAPIAACLIRGFAREMGLDRAIEVATAAIQADGMEAGKEMAGRYGGNSMAELGCVVREVWSEDEGLVIENLEETADSLSFDVTRCGYAEMYEKLDMKDLGVCLSCCRDAPFAKGFNPRMRLIRTQTLMEGGSLCDFRFVLE